MTLSADGTTITAFREEHAFLGSFYPSPVRPVEHYWRLYRPVRDPLTGERVDLLTYPTAEHAFHAGKALTDDDRVRVRDAPTPGAAKRLGRQLVLRPNWEVVKAEVMYHVVRTKFAPGTYLAELLLATRDAWLVEGNWWHDQYWGDCHCNTRRACHRPGVNMLGQILTHVRTELRGRLG